MEDSKKRKIKTFHAMLARMGYMSYKLDMLSAYGVESTSELEEFELDQIITRLREQEQKQHHQNDAELRGLRSVALTILQRMGIYRNNGDWDAVNRFMLNPRVAGKMLYELKPDELRELNKKLRGIERKKAIEKEKVEHLMQNN